MAEVSVGEAAQLLGASPDTVRRLIDRKILRAVRSSGGHRHVDTRSLAAYLETANPVQDLPTVGAESARNRFLGLVTHVVRDTVVAKVDIQSGQHRLVSVMTREAVDELGIEPGSIVVASVKATSVVVEVRAAARPATRATAKAKETSAAKRSKRRS